MSQADATRQVQVLADPPAVAREAVRRFAAHAADAIAARGAFRVALTGGETPRSTYQLLATRRDIDWPHIEVFWGDERAVPPQHPDSNFRLAHETLLSHLPILPQQVHRMPADWPDLDGAALAYENLLRDRLGDPPRFDLVLLGLGEDGHVASLFPRHPAVRETRRLVVATPAPAIAPRLTLTLPAINAAREVLFLVTGSRKSDVVRRILSGPRDPEALPAQGVAPHAGFLVWLLDREAAGTRRGFPARRATP